MNTALAIAIPVLAVLVVVGLVWWLSRRPSLPATDPSGRTQDDPDYLPDDAPAEFWL